MPEAYRPQNSQEKKSGTSEKEEDFKSLHRGVWAEQLEHGQSLPVGGNIFHDDLSIRLFLDFDYFDSQLGNFTEENIRNHYEKGKPEILKWLKDAGSDVDPYLFFQCFQIQKKVHALLHVSDKADPLERNKLYSGNYLPRLSQTVGKSACAERAAMGQYLFQKIGRESVYMSGITMADVADGEEYPEDHSFLIINDPDKPNGTLVFDIARPHTFDMPRVLKTDRQLTYRLFEGQQELLAGATETLSGTRKLWFGIGEPTAGTHKTL